MPRKRRFKSRSNIYHIMLRGVNRQQIFFDEEDYWSFQHLVAQYKPICGYKLYAYCIMGNHIHLLMQTGEEPLELVFRRLETAFVYWYNTKYERVGHLFQDRYRCEPVETEEYFFTVLRYILRNPVAAGLCQKPEEYPYSSAQAYFGNAVEGCITDMSDVLERAGKEELRRYVAQDNRDQCMDMDEIIRKRLTDKMAKERILCEFGTYSPAIGPAWNREEFSLSIKKLINEGVSIRQLSRLTGLSKKIIERCLK